jgi:hypothetical protein
MNLAEVPGITLGLPFEEYLKLPGISTSALKWMMRSPLAFKWAQDHPDTSTTPSKSLGTAAHAAILEPHRLKTDFVLWDGGDRRGKAWTEFKESNAGRQILTVSEFEDVKAMHSAVRGFPPASRYLENGVAEVTLQWIDPATGRAMKGRVDWVTVIDGQIVLVDLKTTRDASPRKFGADAYRLGYHLQFAIYTDGWFHLTRETPRFVVIAAENNAPFEPAVFDVTEDILAQGHEEYMGLLATLKECEQTNAWPPRCQEEQPLTLPAWALNDDEDLSDIGLDLTA